MEDILAFRKISRNPKFALRSPGKSLRESERLGSWNGREKKSGRGSGRKGTRTLAVNKSFGAVGKAIGKSGEVADIAGKAIERSGAACSKFPPSRPAAGIFVYKRGA